MPLAVYRDHVRINCPTTSQARDSDDADTHALLNSIARRRRLGAPECSERKRQNWPCPLGGPARLSDCRNRTLRRAAATHILHSIFGFFGCLFSSNILVQHASLPLDRSRPLRSQLA